MTVVDGSVFKAVKTNISYNAALSGQGAGIHMRHGCDDGTSCTEVVLAECTMDGNDAAGGAGADIRFTDKGNSGEVQKGRLTILNMPSTNLDIGGGGAPVASCSASNGLGQQYCTDILGHDDCRHSGSGAGAQLECFDLDSDRILAILPLFATRHYFKWMEPGSTVLRSATLDMGAVLVLHGLDMFKYTNAGDNGMKEFSVSVSKDQIIWTSEKDFVSLINLSRSRATIGRLSISARRCSDAL